MAVSSPSPLKVQNLFDFKIDIQAPQAKIGESFVCTVNIINKGEESFGGGRIHVRENEYFYPTSTKIPPVPAFSKGWKERVKLIFEPKENCSLRNLAATFQVYITSNEKTIVFATWFSEKMNFFLKDLKEIAPKKITAYNILLFGFAGATKTSFLNSCLTLVSEEVVKAFRQGGSTTHVTTNLTPVYLRPFQKEKAIPSSESPNLFDEKGDYAIRLWDIWGLANTTTFDGDVIEHIVQGKLPQHWEMSDKIEELQAASPELLQQLKVSQHEREIHCVLFFCPQAVLEDPNQKKQREMLSKYFSELSKKGELNPLLLLTKVDEIEPDVRKSPMGHFQKLEDLKAKASATLNIASNRIFYNVNYYQAPNEVDYPEKSFELDKLTYSILLRAAENAKGTYFAKYGIL